VKPLRVASLAVLVVVTGALSWAGSRLWDSMDTLPRVPAAAPVVLFLIAVLLLATGLALRSRLQQQRDRVPGAKGVDPLVAARAVVFGHAAAVVAAVVAGLYGGMGVFLINRMDVPTRRDDVYLAGLSVLGSLAVIAVAFFVQRVLRLPEDAEPES
jgi:membrane protein DedA with SNARE-associated domain